ncbi:MAG: anthranilate synthase component I [Mycobacteriales bacterium]
MTTGVITPDLDGFTTRARAGRVVPVTRRLLADGETPIGLFRKLAGGPGTFLLESAEPGRSWSRYSFVGVRSIATLTELDGQAHWLGEPPAGVATGGDPMTALRDTVAALATPRADDAPPLTGGMVGYLSYDVVRYIERLPDTGARDLPLPELGMMLVTDLAVLDHHDGSLLLIANAILDSTASSDDSAGTAEVANAYHRAVGRLEAMTTALSRPMGPSISTLACPGDLAYDSSMSSADYATAVRECISAIEAGECFQIVPSQRFHRQTSADPLDIYRVLRATNPSPYMYLLRFDGFDIVGSSPETQVKVSNGRALLRPIAGTKPRGATLEADTRLAQELIVDPKERAEHVMLVDLGRNDLGRVCQPGTVDVVDFMEIERYSHVMHIVSTVIGELEPGRTAYDVLAATFPAGTVSGSPKVRAMEIIDSLEPTRRGLYGGAVGYLDFGGDMDTAIAIRTALLHDGIAYVQAGAGVVADSDPLAEEQESRNKAAAVLSAIAAAQTMQPAR